MSFVDRDFLIQLTTALYRLTLLFPKKEPLRYKMREVGDDILADLLLIIGNYEPENSTNFFKKPEARPLEILEKMGVLDGFFEVAKEQNWVVASDILAIQKEYAILKGELEKIILEEKEGTQGHPNLFEAGKESIKEESEKAETEENKGNPSGVIQLPPFSSLANLERQEKIMAFLKEQGRAQVWQIKQILPEVTKRTLRRDFDNLLKKGLVERIGERNNTFYQIKIIQL